MDKSTVDLTIQGHAPRGQLTEAAYQHVKALILDGRSKPGERIDVNDVVSALATSRQPVMTALRRLESEGLVAITPQSGCRVSTPERNMIDDFFRAFAAVEGVAAEIAAERASAPAVLELIKINERIRRLDDQKWLSAPERGKRYRAMNQQFHRKVHDIGRAGPVSRVAESFWDRADFYIVSTHGLSPFITRILVSCDEHDEIVRAIEGGRSVQARRLMEAHIRSFASAAAI
jgi:DNA-binding GntR family transcriptional regulator